MARHKELNANGKLLMSMYRRNAIKRGLTWKLTEDEFLKLTQSRCYVCGVKPRQRYIHSHKRKSLVAAPFIYNGIDRLDSKTGYEMGLVASCCGDCNIAKKEMSLKQFLRFILRVYNFALAGTISKVQNDISSSSDDEG